MTAASDKTLALIGMRETGKSTYIGRLWLGAHEKTGRLHAVGLPEQLRPFQQASEYLLNGRYPLRSNPGQQVTFSSRMRWAGKKQSIPFTLGFSDYSGEELERIFERRDADWTDAWKQRARGSDGLLLFLQPDQQHRRPAMSDRLIEKSEAEWAELQEALEEDVALAATTLSTAIRDEAADHLESAYLPKPLIPGGRAAEPGEMAKPPTSVALVEVLQFLREERGLFQGQPPDPDRLRVAVVVSAWDVVKEPDRARGPEPFVERFFPMLYDFLISNFLPEGLRVFGLSSTGGDLKDDAFRQQYEASDPEHMGAVVYHATHGGPPLESKDIDLPVGWLLEGEPALPNAAPR